MKRALAERAKQSLSSPSRDASDPPTKLRRVASSPEAIVSSCPNPPFEDGTASTEPVTSSHEPTGMGLIARPSLSTSASLSHLDTPSSSTAALLIPDKAPVIISSAPTATAAAAPVRRRATLPELAVPDDGSAFYLKHQNRALAVEWRDLQHQLQAALLERDVRRKHCRSSVQVLQSLHATWRQLEDAVRMTMERINTSESLANGESNNSATFAAPPRDFDAVASTGTGDDVEWTVALSEALTQLGQQQDLPPFPCDSSADAAAALAPEWSLKCASAIAARASLVQEKLVSALLRPSHTTSNGDASEHDDIAPLSSSHQSQLHELQSQLANVQSQLLETTAARSEAVASERKLRRNFYKLQAGLLTKEQFLTDMNMQSDDQVGDWYAEVELAEQKKKRQLQDEANESNHDAGSSSQPQSNGPATDSAHVEALMGQIQDLEQRIATRDESIQSLSEQLIDKEKRINDLSTKQQSDEDRINLETLRGTARQLEAAQATAASLELKLQDTRQKWALSLGNEQTIQHAMEEQQQKFAKKWEEMSAALLEGELPLDGNGDAGVQQPLQTITDPDISSLLHVQAEFQAQQIIGLQHKLTQAIANVRQAESTREGYKDALILNDSLHSKLEELKSKYMAAKNSAASSTPLKPDSENTSTQDKDATVSVHAAESSVPTAAVSHKDGAGNGAHVGAMSAEKIEKMHREHRRMRKDLSVIIASKEAAKAKLERAEKERDSLMEMNARLLRQMTEKDDMNAKSLSTILHLKSMTEQLIVERDNLEQQAKSASQLALASRLAMNAKERFAEEESKEKKGMEDQLLSLEEQIVASTAELDRMAKECSEANGRIAGVNTELANALKRSDELVYELEKKDLEIRDLVDLVRSAERKANEASQQLGAMADTSGNGVAAASTFSVEQLNTQIGVLKSKLACPVCHYRDKECIILRCRHLHCKQCVEDRISSRNRKCPTCNNKFTEKDVADIWLNT